MHSLWQPDAMVGGHGPRNSSVRSLPLTMDTRFHKSALLLCLCAFLSGCLELECNPPVPPLLHDLQASGGWWTNGCPPRGRFSGDYRSDDEAVSPELTRRIRERFPQGSDAVALERYLLGEGFQISSPCGEHAPRVRQAQFYQEQGCLHPMNAKIAWERAEDGTVTWIKANVFFK